MAILWMIQRKNLCNIVWTNGEAYRNNPVYIYCMFQLPADSCTGTINAYAFHMLYRLCKFWKIKSRLQHAHFACLEDTILIKSFDFAMFNPICVCLTRATWQYDDEAARRCILWTNLEQRARYEFSPYECVCQCV